MIIDRYSSPDHDGLMYGIIAALSAGVFLGLFQSLKGKDQVISVRTATMILLLVAVVLINGTVLFVHGPALYQALGVPAILLFALSGTIHFCGGWLMIGLSQRRVGVGITGLLVGTTPVFTALIAWLALGEQLDVKDMVGILLVVAGVGLASWR